MTTQYIRWPDDSGGGGGSIAIGGEITGGSDNAILFVHPSQVLAQDVANFSYDADTALLTLTNAPVIVAFGTAGIVHNSSAGVLTSSLIVNADVSASAAIAYSKLTLTGSIVNADINASAAIAYSKLNLANSILNADINTSAAIAYSKLAAMTTGQALLGNAGVPTATTLSGDVTVGATGVTAIGASKVTNTMLAGSIDLTTKALTGTANQLLGANNAASANEFKTLSGTSNQISVTHGVGTITLATPQSIGTGSSPTFASLVLSGLLNLTPSNDAATGSSQALSVPSTSFVRLTAAGTLVSIATIPAPSNATYLILSNVTGAAVQILDETGATTANRIRTGVGATITVAINGTVALIYDTTTSRWRVLGFENPMDAAGQLLYGGTAGVPTKVAAGTSGQYLKSNGTSAPAYTSFVVPTVQKFTSGSGTYTTPTSPAPIYIRVRMVGAGGGGAGSATIAGTGGNNGSNGGNTTFGTTLLVANGGAGGQSSTGTGAGGAGGTASLGTGPIGLAVAGSSGQGFSQSATGGRDAGGQGASSALGGGGGGGLGSGGAGLSATTNSGGGGGGGGAPTTGYSGAGGGAGGFVDAIISAPSATYSYAIGALGAKGGAGTSGGDGGDGAAGVILVEEFYQ